LASQSQGASNQLEVRIKPQSQVLEIDYGFPANELGISNIEKSNQDDVREHHTIRSSLFELKTNYVVGLYKKNLKTYLSNETRFQVYRRERGGEEKKPGTAVVFWFIKCCGKRYENLFPRKIRFVLE